MPCVVTAFPKDKTLIVQHRQVLILWVVVPGVNKLLPYTPRNSLLDSSVK